MDLDHTAAGIMGDTGPPTRASPVTICGVWSFESGGRLSSPGLLLHVVLLLCSDSVWLFSSLRSLFFLPTVLSQGEHSR